MVHFKLVMFSIFQSCFMDWRPVLCASINISPITVINSTFRKIFNARSQETVDVCLEMFNCLQAEQTIAIRKRKFLNRFSVISPLNNALCQVFVAKCQC